MFVLICGKFCIISHRQVSLYIYLLLPPLLFSFLFFLQHFLDTCADLTLCSHVTYHPSRVLPFLLLAIPCFPSHTYPLFVFHTHPLLSRSHPVLIPSPTNQTHTHTHIFISPVFLFLPQCTCLSHRAVNLWHVIKVSVSLGPLQLCLCPGSKPPTPALLGMRRAPLCTLLKTRCVCVYLVVFNELCLCCPVYNSLVSRFNVLLLLFILLKHSI